MEYRTFRNWEKNGVRDKRKGAAKKVANKLTEKEEMEIIKIACQKRFRDLTPYEIVPILAEEGRYVASASTFYRVLKKAELLTYRGKAQKACKQETVELKATGPGQLLSWDISYLKTNVRGSFYYLYMVIDVWSRVILGWEIHKAESGDIAKELFVKISHKYGLRDAILHSDNGGPMRCATMAATLELLGVIQSFSRPSVSNDNAYSESLFKTLKYTAGYPRHFSSIKESRKWIESFVNWYNTQHRHSGIGYVTPMQRHTGKDVKIFAKRNETYETAKAKHPERWAKDTKKWKKEPDVYLKKGNLKRA